MYHEILFIKILGVDDIVSECGLDDFENWDLKVDNNSEENGNCAIETILDIIKQSICNWQYLFIYLINNYLY